MTVRKVTRTRPANSGILFWKEVVDADPALQAQRAAFDASMLSQPGVISFTRSIVGDSEIVRLEWNGEVFEKSDPIFLAANFDNLDYVNSLKYYYSQQPDIIESVEEPASE